MMENDVLRFALENWQVVFVYGLKILNDIKKSITAHEIEIQVMKRLLLEREI